MAGELQPTGRSCSLVRSAAAAVATEQQQDLEVSRRGKPRKLVETFVKDKKRRVLLV